jgi:hypothetical protein
MLCAPHSVPVTHSWVVALRAQSKRPRWLSSSAGAAALTSSRDTPLGSRLVTYDLPPTVGPGDPAAKRAKRGLPQSPAHADCATSGDKAEPTKRNAAPRSATRHGQAAPVETPPPATLVLRWADPPANQLDFDDRHDTRATESDAMARRYTWLREGRRTDAWHHLAMSIVVFVVSVMVYLAGFVVVSQLLPRLSPSQVAQVVGVAYVAAGGGIAARAAGRVLTIRFRSQRRGPNSV